MKFAAVAVTCVFCSSPARVTAGPALDTDTPMDLIIHGTQPLRLYTNALCITDGGSNVELEPGRYMPEQWWLDHEADDIIVRTDIVRLKAENDSFRKSVAGRGVGWGTVMLVGAALVTGTFIGTQL